MTLPLRPVSSFSLSDASSGESRTLWGRKVDELIRGLAKNREDGVAGLKKNKYVFNNFIFERKTQQSQSRKPQNTKPAVPPSCGLVFWPFVFRFCPGCYIDCCAHAEQVPKVCSTNGTRNTDAQTRARESTEQF